MLLTVDVGNTNIHLGVFAGVGDHAKLVRDWRIHTDPHYTADELAWAFRGMLGPDIEQVTGVAALSTVPSLLRELRVMVPRYFGSGPHVLLEPGVRTGVPLLVDNPKEVGTDRVANCLAAHHEFGGPCIVVAFGTATVVDAVSEKGEFLGGAIAPGVNLAVEALSEHTVTVRKVELMPPRSVLGKNTVEALQSGILYGFAGQVDGLVERVRDTVDGFGDDDVPVVATGYLAPLMFDECRSLTDHHTHLTLEGLRLVHERSKAGPRRAR
ncbi:MULTISPECIES: type III pantothenate kinase [unclassified Gordonia (in: high G+C Gram-positive bacteria)]|uniref:type III pantothenate kinase n=1 Tax=unclassified Gordonia (in: high G+C Gram-positive bacteria) TaxID=2657482 RepID=UPI001F0FCF2D|nr:type III pantothenate kinase [Gordonia sp. ABSL49_1]MCH5644866.1 type III pantothenate kinase [Gordonia sp. ABSL49_1]